MAITLNKKICLEFFKFFGGFRITVSKLMERTVYSEFLRKFQKNFEPGYPLEINIHNLGINIEV